MSTPQPGNRRPNSGIDIDPKQLMRLRTVNALSRQQLCEQAGISLASLTKYENSERRPRTRAFRALYTALKCEPAELLKPARRRAAGAK